MAGMAGTTIVSAELSPEISPTFELEGRSVEWNFLKGVRDVYVGQRIAASALNTGFWRFRNPIGSGVAACFELIELSPETTGGLSLAVNQLTVDLATAQPTAVPDSRWGPLTTGRSALVASFQNTTPGGVAGQSVARAQARADVAWRYNEEIFLPPGVVLDAGAAAINIAISGTFKWHERPFPVLER